MCPDVSEIDSFKVTHLLESLACHWSLPAFASHNRSFSVFADRYFLTSCAYSLWTWFVVEFRPGFGAPLDTESFWSSNSHDQEREDSSLQLVDHRIYFYWFGLWDAGRLRQASRSTILALVSWVLWHLLTHASFNHFGCLGSPTLTGMGQQTPQLEVNLYFHWCADCDQFRVVESAQVLQQGRVEFEYFEER